MAVASVGSIDTAHALEALLRDFGLSRDRLAQLLRTTTRTVQRWLQGTTPSPPYARRIRDLHCLDQRLGDVLTADGVRTWLHARNRELGGNSPLDLLTIDRTDEVLSAIDVLETGPYT